MFEQYPAILITKLYVPRVRRSHISRSHLLSVLDTGLDRKLILIAAAAGFGKTTLIADWASQYADDVCWYSLDEGDNDPARFLSYLIAAIQTRRPHIGQELLAALQSPQPPAVEHTLHSLINQLAASPQRLVIVLDDYHVIDHQAIHAALAFLFDHLPLHLTLVLMSRADPPLPLARLRARNDLLELRAAELRFSIDEASHFLNENMQIDLSREAVQALDSRTEGWIAGLQLAAVAMQTLPGDKQAFVRSFTGSHRFVLDYLIEEVLSHQPDDVRRFLLQTSILHRLNGALCSAVTGDADGQAMLDYLERHNLFLIPLDQARYWYRYHHLFGDLLQARLQVEYPAALQSLYQRAVQWYEQNDLPEEAVVYALTAQDFDYAAQLIAGPAAGVAQRGEAATLLDWYTRFPSDVVARYPRLCLHFGLAFALNGRWDEAETLLHYVEGAANSDFPPGEALLLAYLVAVYRQDTASLATIAEKAAANAQSDRVARLVLAFIVSLNGDMRYGCQLLAEAQELSERAGDTQLALTTLFHQCRFHVLLGDLHRGYELSHQALQRLHDLGGSALPMATFAHVSLGRILIEWNDLDNAAQHLTQAIRLSELNGFVTGMLSSGTMMLAEVKQAQGDTEGAIQTAQTAISYAERYDPPPEVNWLKSYQARLWLIQGNTSAAVNWLRSLSVDQPPSMFYPLTIQQVTRARVLLAQRKTNEAIALLTRLTAQPHDLLAVEALAVLALARQSNGDNVNAMLTLEQALTLAQTENRIRAILDLGFPMAKLLTRFCETHPDHTFARQLLAAFAIRPEAAQPVEPLSERERDILRLIVAGQSNEEIARTLTLAVSTVKWYINTLYGKLHVKTRSQAIARTHELRLLAD
ncbi:MAG: AAA family ATPase [Anaerolineae bacterium]|nr:AAA family ATPase [Anaerolineae bacterium]